MTVEELKTAAKALFEEIQTCVEQDSEWTSPRGNGVNCCEAEETARAFMDLILEVK